MHVQNIFPSWSHNVFVLNARTSYSADLEIWNLSIGSELNAWEFDLEYWLCDSMIAVVLNSKLIQMQLFIHSWGS